MEEENDATTCFFLGLCGETVKQAAGPSCLGHILRLAPFNIGLLQCLARVWHEVPENLVRLWEVTHSSIPTWLVHWAWIPLQYPMTTESRHIYMKFWIHACDKVRLSRQIVRQSPKEGHPMLLLLAAQSESSWQSHYKWKRDPGEVATHAIDAQISQICWDHLIPTDRWSSYLFHHSGRMCTPREYG